MAHDKKGFSHHCPECNHHILAICVMDGQVEGLRIVLHEIRSRLNSGDHPGSVAMQIHGLIDNAIAKLNGE